MIDELGLAKGTVGLKDGDWVTDELGRRNDVDGNILGISVTEELGLGK